HSPRGFLSHSSVWKMEDDDSPYLNWLLQYNPSEFEFINTLDFAEFCENITSIYGEGEDKISLYEIIEELKKEEREQCESIIIRKHVIHLLKLVAETPEQISIANYKQHLYERMRNTHDKKLKPLRLGKSVHTLNSEAKLFLFMLLHRQSKRTTKLLNKHFAIDSENNKYYCVNGHQLRVNYGKRLNDLDKTVKKEKVQRNEFKQRPLKLLAETREQWLNVAGALENFGEVKAANSITNELKGADFSQIMTLSGAISKEEETSEHKGDVLIEENELVTVNIDEPIETFTVGIARCEISSEEIENPPTKSILKKRKNVCFNLKDNQTHFFTPDDPEPADQVRNAHTKNSRCLYYPKCVFGARCRYSHPFKECIHFKQPGECDRERYCPDRHGLCIAEKMEGKCFDTCCIYEHANQPHPCRQKICNSRTPN
ncbi:hypothetical protein PMAYCL1PPCAC_05900, partial [Pristionchus mayeri]